MSKAVAPDFPLGRLPLTQTNKHKHTYRYHATTQKQANVSVHDSVGNTGASSYRDCFSQSTNTNTHRYHATMQKQANMSVHDRVGNMGASSYRGCFSQNTNTNTHTDICKLHHLLQGAPRAPCAPPLRSFLLDFTPQVGTTYE